MILVERSRWSKTEKKIKITVSSLALSHNCDDTSLTVGIVWGFFPRSTSKPELFILNHFFSTPCLGYLEKWKPALNDPSFFKTRMWWIRNFPKFYAAVFIRNFSFPKQSTNLWTAIESPIFPVRIFSNEGLQKNGVSFWGAWYDSKVCNHEQECIHY